MNKPQRYHRCCERCGWIGLVSPSAISCPMSTCAGGAGGLSPRFSSKEDLLEFISKHQRYDKVFERLYDEDNGPSYVDYYDKKMTERLLKKREDDELEVARVKEVILSDEEMGNPVIEEIDLSDLEWTDDDYKIAALSGDKIDKEGE